MAKAAKMIKGSSRPAARIRRHHSQRATLIGPSSSTKIGRVTELRDTPAIRGMIAKVSTSRPRRRREITRNKETGADEAQRYRRQMPGSRQEAHAASAVAIGSGKGKTAGRGGKGSDQRVSGVRIKGFEGGQMAASTGACPSAASPIFSGSNLPRSISNRIQGGDRLPSCSTPKGTINAESLVKSRVYQARESRRAAARSRWSSRPN